MQRESYIYSTTTFTAKDKTLPLYTHANHSSYVAFTPPKAAQAEICDDERNLFFKPETVQPSIVNSSQQMTVCGVYAWRKE